MMLLPLAVMAQINPNSPEYEQMKLNGQLPQEEVIVNIPSSYPPVTEPDGNRDAGYFIPLDGTFTVAMARNDDGSSALISLPFTFCLYGINYTSLYINNNGNVTFTAPYGTYTPFGFPSSPLGIVAPFFADVDTRPTASGLVYYRIDLNPKRIIVIWDNVGYFANQTDKRNSFQLIMTEGNDPLIGIGKNVAFAYGEMQWTTGSASGGLNGFGGAPATVGVNKGDGINFALVGRFDAPGTCYDGPGGATDCVGYLTGKRYVFDACQDEIIINPPAEEVPVSNWALFIGIGLILVFAVMRFRRMA